MDWVLAYSHIVYLVLEVQDAVAVIDTRSKQRFNIRTLTRILYIRASKDNDSIHSSSLIRRPLYRAYGLYRGMQDRGADPAYSARSGMEIPLMVLFVHFLPVTEGVLNIISVVRREPVG